MNTFLNRSVLLKEAFGIARCRELLWNLVSQDLKLKYRRSWLGFFWSLLNPLLMMLILYAIFSTIFGGSTEHYGAYVIVGVLVWQMYVYGTSRSTRVFFQYAGIMKTANVPRSIFPLSVTLSSAVNFLLSLIPTALILLFTNVSIKPTVLLLPVCLVLVLVFIFGVALLLASVAVLFHDVVHIYEILVLLLMYASAIFYPISILPDDIQLILQLNPMYHFIMLFRECIYGDIGLFAKHLVFCSLFSAVSISVGAFVYKANRNKIIHHI